MKIRIIPACAGKRTTDGGTIGTTKDHPRMRGEKTSTSCLYLRELGSSPHARGKVEKQAKELIALRIIPACAGKRLKKYRKIGHPKMPIYFISFSL